MNRHVPNILRRMMHRSYVSDVTSVETTRRPVHSRINRISLSRRTMPTSIDNQGSRDVSRSKCAFPDSDANAGSSRTQPGCT